MSNQFTVFVEYKNLLDKKQHVFKAGKSVITTSFDLVEFVINAIDKVENFVGVFLDLSKAFDCNHHWGVQ